ncbi:MAG: BrxE family protein [Blastocatellia bacterium]|nr:BrxE family protein [Blastocatellia bacterium]
MKESSLYKYLLLRLIIGYLGERSQFAWWPTSVFEPSSKSFLEPVFAKTYRLAQYHSVKEAARRLHDEYIGIGNVFHLFRLPEEIEQDLHALMLGSQGDEEALANLRDKDTAMQTLSTIAEGMRTTTEGPVAIGNFRDILTPVALKGAAQSYLAAFEQGIKTYPYFIG